MVLSNQLHRLGHLYSACSGGDSKITAGALAARISDLNQNFRFYNTK